MSEIDLSGLSPDDLLKLTERIEQEQVERLEQARAELRERWTKEAEAAGFRSAGQRSISGTSKSWDAESLSAWLDEHPGQARYLQRFLYFGSSDDRNFELFKALHRSVKRSWGGVELLSCIVGGMFCLNLAVRMRPKRLWLLDRNPLQLLLFELVKRVVLQSGDRHDFMRRLREGDYETSPAGSGSSSRACARSFRSTTGRSPRRICGESAGDPSNARGVTRSTASTA